MPSTNKHLISGAVLALGLAGSALLPGGSPAAQAVTAGQAPASAASSARSTPHRHAHHAHHAEFDPRHRDHGYGIRLTQFNILSSAMAPGGLSRATRAAHWVQGQRATAAAFEEVAPDQLRQLQRVMPGYKFWPRRQFGTRGSAIQIGWRTREVELMRTGHVMGPFLGYQRPVPYVQLRDRHTHRRFWVMAIHNAPGGHESERNAETRVEIAALKKLVHTHDPVFAIGDVNERQEFCLDVAHATVLNSLNGGTRSHSCPVPRKGGPDWMLGAGADPSGFAKVYNHISDHPALTVKAHIPATR